MRGGKRPGAGRPRKDAPAVVSEPVVLTPEVRELVSQYARRKKITRAEAMIRLLAWGARLSAAYTRRRNQTEIKQGR